MNRGSMDGQAEIRDNLIGKETKFLLLVALFITFQMIALLTGSKIIVFLGLTLSTGTLAISLTYPITDVITEIWGKQTAKRLVFVSLICWVVLLVMVYINIKAEPAPFWEMQEAYACLFGTSMRLILAGFVAYTIAQFHDIYAFSFWKNKTRGKYLWLRNNFSTAVSQLINTVVVVTIGFGGIIPHTALLPTIFGWWLIKMLIAACDTPLVYLLVWWIFPEKIKK